MGTEQPNYLHHESRPLDAPPDADAKQGNQAKESQNAATKDKPANPATEPQIAAMKQVATLLNEMGAAAARESPRDGEATQKIRPNNSNRVILINGKRGSGKTSVLVTLLKWLHQRESREPYSAADVGRLFGQDAERGMPRIVAANIIDMQPLPENTHLMMHLASALYGLGREKTRTCGDDALREQLDDCWEKLAMCIGKAWSRHAGARDLPPDELALELKDVNGDQDQLRAVFADFVRLLLKVVDQRPTRNDPTRPRPLLLIPIDDADLAAWRCYELLELVRWFSHPNIVFLLAGDEDGFIRATRIHITSRFMRPLKDLAFDRWRFQALLSESAVNSLAWQTFNKVIPSGHRATIEPVELARRLEILESALSAVPVDPEDGSSSSAAVAQSVVSTVRRPTERPSDGAGPEDDSSDPLPEMQRSERSEGRRSRDGGSGGSDSKKDKSLFAWIKDAGLAAALPSEMRDLLLFKAEVEVLIQKHPQNDEPLACKIVTRLQKHPQNDEPLACKIVTRLAQLAADADGRLLKENRPQGVPEDATHTFEQELDRLEEECFQLGGELVEDEAAKTDRGDQSLARPERPQDPERINEFANPDSKAYWKRVARATGSVRVGKTKIRVIAYGANGFYANRLNAALALRADVYFLFGKRSGVVLPSLPIVWSTAIDPPLAWPIPDSLRTHRSLSSFTQKMHGELAKNDEGFVVAYMEELFSRKIENTEDMFHEIGARHSRIRWPLLTSPNYGWPAELRTRWLESLREGAWRVFVDDWRNAGGNAWELLSTEPIASLEGSLPTTRGRRAKEIVKSWKVKLHSWYYDALEYLPDDVDLRSNVPDKPALTFAGLPSGRIRFTESVSRVADSVFGIAYRANAGFAQRKSEYLWPCFWKAPALPLVTEWSAPDVLNLVVHWNQVVRGLDETPLRYASLLAWVSDPGRKFNWRHSNWDDVVSEMVDNQFEEDLDLGIIEASELSKEVVGQLARLLARNYDVDPEGRRAILKIWSWCPNPRSSANEFKKWAEENNVETESGWIEELYPESKPKKA